jgi:hypothetical protein
MTVGVPAIGIIQNARDFHGPALSHFVSHGNAPSFGLGPTTELILNQPFLKERYEGAIWTVLVPARIGKAQPGQIHLS